MTVPYREAPPNGLRLRNGKDEERYLEGMVVINDRIRIGGINDTPDKKATRVSRQTVTRDLDDMVKKGILEQRGERRGAFYVKAKIMPQL
jgi:Fic family protein